MIKVLKGILALILVFFHLNSYGQQCDCKTNLDSLKNSIENNYVGFINKVSGSNKYQQFKDSLYGVVSKAKDFHCYEILKKYVLFFNDPHLNLGVNASDKTYKNSIQLMFSSIPKMNINWDSLNRYYQHGRIDQVEGIWESKDIVYRIAIFKDKAVKDKFIGVTINPDSIVWFPGQTKMEIVKLSGKYKVKFFKNDHFPVFPDIKSRPGYLSIAGNGDWKRVFPADVQKDIPPSPMMSIKAVSKNTNLLVIESSWINYKKNLDTLLAQNRDLLNNTKNLIIDLRNNGGGHIMTFDSILPILYTNPIYTDGLIVKSSYDNIEMYKEAISNPEFPESTKLALSRIISLMEANRDQLVKINQGDTISFPYIKQFPEKVLILVNQYTASASELFLLLAKQSTKVRIAGVNTKGALDYTEIGRARQLVCPFLVYTCPVGMNEHRIYPYIDNVGIKPDVIIPETTNDWIKFSINYLEK